MIRNSWYVAGLSRNFKYKLDKKIITALPIVMWRTQDENVVAFDGRCCHKRFPLWEESCSTTASLRCAYHGLCYDSAGKCVDIPMQRDIPISPVASSTAIRSSSRTGSSGYGPAIPRRSATSSRPGYPSSPIRVTRRSYRADCTQAAAGKGRSVSIAKDEAQQKRFEAASHFARPREAPLPGRRRAFPGPHRCAQGGCARYLGMRKNLLNLRRASSIQNLEACIVCTERRHKMTGTTVGSTCSAL